MNYANTEVTQLLRASSSGDERAPDQLFPIVYDQLRLLAGRHIRNERPGHTLSATALVHEAYLRLVNAEIPWSDRAHFFALSASVMRRILVDHAKQRLRKKRGGPAPPLSLEEALVASPEPDPRILLVDDALKRLAQIDSEKAEMFELSFFGGMTLEETAHIVGRSIPSVHRELKFAKAWILQEAQGERV